EWNVPRPWLCAVFSAGAVLLLVAVALRSLLGRSEELAGDGIVIRPLRFASAVLCCACVPLLLVVERGQMTILALYGGGLAGLWFVHAWLERSRAVFAIFQATLWWAVCYGVTA